MIMWTTNIIEANIAEAYKYAEKAHELKESSRQAADWCVKMAKAHLDFNAEGHDVAERLIAEFRQSNAASPLEPGMMAVYEAKHAELIKKTAEVKMMLEMYK